MTASVGNRHRANGGNSNARPSWIRVRPRRARWMPACCTSSGQPRRAPPVTTRHSSSPTACGRYGGPRSSGPRRTRSRMPRSSRSRRRSRHGVRPNCIARSRPRSRPRGVRLRSSASSGSIGPRPWSRTPGRGAVATGPGGRDGATSSSPVRTTSPDQAASRSIRVIDVKPSRSVADRTVLYVDDNASNLRLVERIVVRRPDITLLGAIGCWVPLRAASGWTSPSSIDQT